MLIESHQDKFTNLFLEKNMLLINLYWVYSPNISSLKFCENMPYQTSTTG
jgi:hypothetical protein